MFEAKGYHGARMSDIARAIGAADGTLYTYFPNKDALLRAVLDEFWAGLIEEAQAAVAGAEGLWPRLAALARRHLAICVENHDFIELSVIAFAPRAHDRETRAHMRGYVAVFDQTFRAGVDRGELRADAALWIARDQFYGALEYSARTLLGRGGGDHGAVVAQLIDTMRRGYGAAARPDRLEALESRLSALESGASRIGPARRAGG